MTDPTILSDDDLDALRVAVLTEQARRRIVAQAPARVAELAAAYEDATANQPAQDWAAITAQTDRVGPGQRVTLDDIEYRNKSGAWLPISAGPAQDPHSIWWERITPAEPAPPTVTRAAWSATAAYKIGDEVTRNGRAYRCLVAHGAAYQGTWGPPTVGVWLDIGPA